MAKFPITEARQELGFTPSTAVRAKIDVGQGPSVGAAIGRGAVALARQELQRKEKEEAARKRIEEKRRQMMDANSAVTANKLRQTANAEFDTFKLTNPQETWEDFRQKQTQSVSQEVDKLNFSPDALIAQQVKSESYNEVETAKALTDATRQLRVDTIEAQTESLTDSFRSGNPEEIVESTRRFIDNGANMGKDKAEVLSDIKAAREAGEKGRVEDLVNGVHAAIESASETNGDFDVARDLAKNSVIPETKQTSLRTAIGTAEKARTARIKDAQAALVKKTTSDTLREYFNGELTVASLNQRHERGLVEDSVFKLAFQGLTETIPENSDPFAAGNIRRANSDFELGAIDRAEVDKIVLENYTKLDGPDRSNVVSDLEDIAAKIIGTAKSNAYSEGKGLMSRRFVGIQSEEDLLDIFRGAGLTDEEKQRINRRFTAEVNNRDLYERAVDDRFGEMRKKGISDIDAFRSESLKILLQYQRKSALSLDELEVSVEREQAKKINAPFAKQFLERTSQLKSVNEMTEQEIRTEKARIRQIRESE